MRRLRQLFRDWSFRRKLTALMTLTSALTLSLAGAAWLVYDWKSSREDLKQEASILARTVGQNLAAALYFDVTDDIEGDLEVLAFHEPVRHAYAFDLAGEVLGSYHREDLTGEHEPVPFRDSGAEFGESELGYYAPIENESEVVGVLYLAIDLEGLRQRRADIAVLVLIVLGCSLSIAFLIAARLQRVISQPLVELAETVRAVSQRKDYSIRAIPHGRDEIGFLTVSFNQMLEAIQSRDASLEQHKDELEQEVEARTLELRQRNDQLRISMEEARSAAVAKSQFLANMSHEIRTPMNGILGMNDLLLESSLTAQQQSYAEIVKGSAETLLEIINDILDFSKIEAGKLKLEDIEFNPTKAIEDVVGLLSGPARKKGIDLVCWLSPDVPRILKGDPVRFRQVVTNLLGNAVKFTEEGRVSVRVDLVERRHPEGAALRAGDASTTSVLKIEVEDTGIGIPDAQRGRLFRSFSQVDASTTRKFGGTGLGLAISQQLVELMGGEIGVESDEGLGSTFWFTAAFDEVADGRTRSFVLPAGLEPPRVLVVDSSAAVREVLHRQLDSWEIEHDVASGSEDALDKLIGAVRAGHPYDLLLVEEGVDLGDLKECLEPASADQGAPSIVLLSWGGTQLEERRLRTVRSVLSKPIRPSQLFDAVAEASQGDDQLGLEPCAEQATATSGPDETERATLRVLLAEDNRVNQMVAGKILERAGFTHVLAAHGGEALEAVQNGAFDVILMDCQMPVMDGFEATRRIRQWEAETGHAGDRIVIVALTANAMKGDRERCLHAGMDDYLSKPVRPDALIARLDEVLVARRRADDAADGEQAA